MSVLRPEFGVNKQLEFTPAKRIAHRDIKRWTKSSAIVRWEKNLAARAADEHPANPDMCSTTAERMTCRLAVLEVQVNLDFKKRV